MIRRKEKVMTLGTKDISKIKKNNILEKKGAELF